MFYVVDVFSAYCTLLTHLTFFILLCTHILIFDRFKFSLDSRFIGIFQQLISLRLLTLIIVLHFVKFLFYFIFFFLMLILNLFTLFLFLMLLLLLVCFSCSFWAPSYRCELSYLLLTWLPPLSRDAL